VLLPDDAYGGTHRLATTVHAPAGLRVEVVDLTDLAAVESAFTPATRMVWIESPTNPLLRVVDIAAVASAAHRHGAIVVVDNTFATPYLQQPLSLGADVVVYSTTKYLGGHSDVVGGAVVLADEELAAKVQFLQFGAGAISSPFDAFLTTRGIKTLAVRMERHSQNAQAVAEALVVAPGVERVYYPGLADHPGHDVAARQMRGFGGMLSVALSGGPAAARRFAESTEVFALAESLGGVESLIGYPSEMTHASVKGTELAVPENVVRLSVGIEDAGDLVADLQQALQR
jgi:cystathionine gamma-synthase